MRLAPPPSLVADPPAVDRVVFEAAPAAIWVTDRAGLILDANPAACQMLGFERDDLIGTTVGALLHPDDRSDRAQRVAAAAAGELLVARRRMRHAEGGWIWVEGRARVLPDDRIVTVVQDVSAVKRTEDALVASERDFRAIFELAAAGKAQADAATGRLLRVNRKLCEVTGYPEGELLERTFGELVHPDDRTRCEATLRAAFASLEGSWSVEVRCLRKDGGVRWVLVSGRRLAGADGLPERLIATIVDITARKRAEEKLLEADRRKDEFLAVLSHELRNPLAPIATSLEILARCDPRDEAARRARATAERQVRHLARLVDDLLDVTRISRGKVQLHLEEVLLGELVARAVDDHRAIFAQAGVGLALEAGGAPLRVRGDATRLAQVAGNLLQNAVKFTPAGGSVTVAVDAVGADARVVVRDDGAGIEPETLAQLFQPFRQAERTLARTRGGLGLGLALVKGLVELHGGSVEARSDGPGRGAELSFRVPLAAAVEAVPAPAAARAPAAGRRVLVVDDNVDAAETLQTLLQLLGHAVEVTHHGAAAVERARAAPPDVVLCDIGLPGMSGFEVARALRADSALARTLLVAVSGYAQPEDRRQAAEAGFDRHVAKPPALEDLEAVLAAAPRSR